MNSLRYSHLAVALSFVFVFSVQSAIPAVNGRQENERQAQLNRAAKKLYKSALDEFKQQRYWDSAVDLTAILNLHPSFEKSDAVAYMLANSLYEMGMYDGADRMYRKLLKNYPKTIYVAEAILGLQKVWFQKQVFPTSLKFYKVLESHYSDNDAIQESRYYAGQTHFQLDDNTLALNIFQQINKKSDYYPFALYSIGLIDLKKKT
ncbi:MAG: tol-pal system YbgF family protein [bacterium]